MLFLENKYSFCEQIQGQEVTAEVPWIYPEAQTNHLEVDLVIQPLTVHINARKIY
jgi:hypothetical protein